jgi:chloramphenicol-sensitive protein RarD
VQYAAPTLNLLIGIMVCGEECPFSRLIGFLLVWSALALLMAGGIVQRARQQKDIAVGSNLNRGFIP